MIEMRLLEILAAFSEERTQAAAAEKLHISQPISAAHVGIEWDQGLAAEINLIKQGVNDHRESVPDRKSVV